MRSIPCVCNTYTHMHIHTLTHTHTRHTQAWTDPLATSAGQHAFTAERMEGTHTHSLSLLNTHTHTCIITQAWTDPLATSAGQHAYTAPPPYLPQQKEWESHARTAWKISPRLAVELAGRFPTVLTLHKEVCVCMCMCACICKAENW